MTVRFANKPNRELVEGALKRLAASVARSRRVQASPDQEDDPEPIESEKGPQNRV